MIDLFSSGKRELIATRGRSDIATNEAWTSLDEPEAAWDLHSCVNAIALQSPDPVSRARVLIRLASFCERFLDYSKVVLREDALLQ